MSQTAGSIENGIDLAALDTLEERLHVPMRVALAFQIVLLQFISRPIENLSM